VKSLVLNETALQDYRLEVEQCELITSEGTLIRFQGDTLPSNATIAPRSFEDVLDASGAPLGIYLGVKRLGREEHNVRSDVAQREYATAGVMSPRFSLREAETPDLFAADGEPCAVHYLIYDLQLIFDPDTQVSAHEYELVKVAEVLRAAESPGAVLSRRYIPPALAVQASPGLTGMLKELRDLLTAKGRELMDYKHQRRMHTIEMGSRDTVYLLMMQMVNRYIPLLHHYLEAETHPSVFYAVLRQLIGEFSTFSETVSVLGGPLPAYRHDQLWECFDAAIRLGKDLLHELTKGPEYVVPLLFDGEYFAAALATRFFEGSNHHFLAVKCDMPPTEIERLLMETGKICSREDMAALRQRALPGLTARYLVTPPDELPRRAHYHYFELDHYGDLWRHIEQRQNLAVYCQLPPEKSEMQLLVVSET
jgi:type VI secretion system protein ImpJ